MGQAKGRLMSRRNSGRENAGGQRGRRLAARAGFLAVTVSATLGLSAGIAQAKPPAPPVQPFVSCYWSNGDGSYTVDVGYTNSTATTLTYPVGPTNFISPAPADRGQPTVFYPGTHNNVWAPTITQSDLSAGADWTVNGAHASANIASIPQCASKPIPISGGAGGVLLAAATTVVIGGIGFRYRVRYRGLRDRLRFGRA